MGVTAGIFLASILLKEMRYLVYVRYLWGGLVKKGVGHEVFLTEKGGSPKNISSEGGVQLFIIVVL
jgi:hypothetical protein